MPPRKLNPVVSVINMKGGVGKTLVSANVFHEIFRRKRKRVLLIDFDPQFNLSQLLLGSTQYDDLKSSGKTLISVLEPPTPTSVFQISQDDLLDTGPVDSYTHRLKYVIGSEGVEFRLLAGDFGLAKLHLRERDESLRVPRKRFAKFVDKARSEYDLVVLDCNPATSFLTRSALEVSSHLVIPLRPDRYSLLGAEMLFEFMQYLPTLAIEPIKMLLLNGMAANGGPETEIVSQLRSNTTFGPLTLVAEVPQSDVLKARPDFAGVAVDRRVPYTDNVAFRLGQVADEIATKLGL